MKNIKALKEERGHLLDELAGLQTVIEREARSMSELETNRLNDIEARLSSIANEVEKLDKLQNLAAQAAGNSVSRSEEKEKSKMKDQYSFKRAMEMAISGRRDGVEGEFNAIAAEEYQRSGVSVSAHSIKIPSEVFKRDMTATGGSSGSEGGSEFHVQGPVESLLGQGWDLMIAHPPCTHLAVSGARWFKDKQREQAEALDFVRLLLDAPIGRIALENPVSIISSRIRKPNQVIQPWMFGHGETKATCLWLKNLPCLRATKIVEGREAKVHRMSPGPDRWKERSRTYQGIADAMAQQWG